MASQSPLGRMPTQGRTGATEEKGKVHGFPVDLTRCPSTSHSTFIFCDFKIACGLPGCGRGGEGPGWKESVPGPETLDRLFLGKHGREAVRAERPRRGTTRWQAGLQAQDPGHMPHSRPALWL